MNRKIRSVGAGFQKGVTWVYAGYVFLNLACMAGKTNSFDFGVNGFMP